MTPYFSSGSYFKWLFGKAKPRQAVGPKPRRCGQLGSPQGLSTLSGSDCGQPVVHAGRDQAPSEVPSVPGTVSRAPSSIQPTCLEKASCAWRASSSSFFSSRKKHTLTRERGPYRFAASWRSQDRSSTVGFLFLRLRPLPGMAPCRAPLTPMSPTSAGPHPPARRRSPQFSQHAFFVDQAMAAPRLVHKVVCLFRRNAFLRRQVNWRHCIIFCYSLS